MAGWGAICTACATRSVVLQQHRNQQQSLLLWWSCSLFCAGGRVCVGVQCMWKCAVLFVMWANVFMSAKAFLFMASLADIYIYIVVGKVQKVYCFWLCKIAFKWNIMKRKGLSFSEVNLSTIDARLYNKFLNIPNPVDAFGLYTNIRIQIFLILQLFFVVTEFSKKLNWGKSRCYLRFLHSRLPTKTES